jgi:hypothetical protein
MADSNNSNLNNVKIVGDRFAVDLHELSKSENILHYFRSFNTNHTISCIPASKLLSKDDVHVNMDNYVVVKSGGKNTERNSKASSRTTLEKGSEFITSADGTYLDFFIDDVEIETLADFNQQTGFSKATKLKFTITEPYSLSGFLQTLQAAAAKAGYVSYLSATFVLCVSFSGWEDWEDDPEIAYVGIEPASRYFVFRFTGMSVKADELGTKYNCTAVPLNELGFGNANKLRNNITVKGNTVGDILKNLFERLNDLAKYSIYTGNIPDEYEIKYPSIDENGKLTEDKPNVIFDQPVANIDEANINFSFLNPAGPPTKAHSADSKIISTTFAANSNVHDCIEGIIRDSQYITRLFKQELKSLVDANGMLDSFNIICTVSTIGWLEQYSRPIYKFTYNVVPHKIHYSRIPKYATNNFSATNLRNRVRRRYNYLFSGKNLDIIRFDLNFNYLYFQSQVQGEGFDNINQSSNAANAAKSPEANPNIGNQADKASITAAGGSAVSISVDTRLLEQSSGGANTRAGVEKSPAIAMAKNFHKAIKDNLSQSLLELEILGDPYFLSQQGMNNFIYQDDPSISGITSNGDMSYQTGEIFVEITFRNPVDINPNTGMMDFSDQVTSYSGIYRLTKVNNKFVNGVFTQTLYLVKLERQSENLPDPKEITNSINKSIKDLENDMIKRYSIAFS